MLEFRGSRLKVRPMALAKCVALHQVGPKRYEVVNTISLETAVIDGDADLVVEEESGDVMLAADLNGQAMALDTKDLLRKTVFLDGEGVRYLCSRDQVGRVSWQCLDEVEKKYKRSDATLCVGGGRATCSFKVYAFFWPRALNQRCFWCLNDCYTYLGLKCYKGFPGRWISRCKTAWAKSWCDLVGEEHALQIIHSIDERGQSEAIAALREPLRCLPTPALSTFGLMVNLLRWYCLSQNKGGLEGKNLKARRAARSMLSGILDAVASGAQKWTVHLVICKQWVSSWPASLPACDGEAVVEVTCDRGVLDLGPLEEACSGPGKTSVGRQIWKSLQRSIGDVGSCSLLVALEALMRNNCLKGLLAQILYKTAKQVERVLALQASPKKQAGVGMTCQWKDRWGGVGGRGVKQGGCCFLVVCLYFRGVRGACVFHQDFKDLVMEDRGILLISYIMAAKDEVRDMNEINFSCATDKGNVWGLGLQKTFFCTPDNLLIYACPMVTAKVTGNTPFANSSLPARLA